MYFFSFPAWFLTCICNDFTTQTTLQAFPVITVNNNFKPKGKSFFDIFQIAKVFDITYLCFKFVCFLVVSLFCFSDRKPIKQKA